MFPFFSIHSRNKYVDYVTKIIQKTSGIKIFTYLFRIDTIHVVSYGCIHVLNTNLRLFTFLKDAFVVETGRN